MFVDTSVLVAILSREDDAETFSERLAVAAELCTSPLVVLEAVMRLSSKLDLSPARALASVNASLAEARISVVPITEADSATAVAAFETYGKGRGHKAQLNIADCLSYACAKNRGLRLLYKGNDFAATDLA